MKNAKNIYVYITLHTSIYYIARSLEFSDDVRANDLFMILPSVDSSFCVF